ncbi:uncharacterized protein LOC144178303 isoform X3 [Haemaphysalis longicornis]
MALFGAGVSAECGIAAGPSNESRIVGGVSTNVTQWPWQVSLHRRRHPSGSPGRRLCSASLVSATWILTAAHCLLDPGADAAAAGGAHLPAFRRAGARRPLRDHWLGRQGARATGSDVRRQQGAVAAAGPAARAPVGPLQARLPVGGRPAPMAPVRRRLEGRTRTLPRRLRRAAAVPTPRRPVAVVRAGVVGRRLRPPPPTGHVRACGRVSSLDPTGRPAPSTRGPSATRGRLSHVSRVGPLAGMRSSLIPFHCRA